MVPFMRANGNRPFFSIVTICRENLSGLRRCVRNIRQQSFDSYEHLVVDSASKDGTAEYLRTQCDDKLSFISEPDDGIYHAINKGISGANGVVVLLLHSDDLLSHGALKRVHDCFAKNNVDAVYGDALYFGKDGRFLQYKPARFYGEEVVLRGMPAAHEAMFIRRSLYEKIGFYDETYRSASDYKLVSHMHLDEVKVAKTYRVELYKLVGGVSFGSDIDRSENFRLLKEHVPAISENLAPKLGSLKNFRTASAVDLCSIYDSISTLNAPSWFFKAISKTLIKILLGDAAEADPDPIRQAPDVFQLRSDKERLLFTIAGLKGVAGGAEKVLVTLVNELKQTTDAEIIVSTAEGRAGFPHYTMDPSIVFIDIYEKPYDELLAANLDLRTELDEIVNRLPEEILFVVSECGKCREHFQSWRQFVKSCRSTSESTAGEIRETLRNEIAVWVRKYGTRVSRWRKLISYYGVASVVAFMISTSTQLFVAIGKTPAKLIISNHGNPIRDYLYQDDWDNSMLDRAIRLFALYSAKNSQWLDDEFLEFIPEPARKVAVVIPNPVNVSPLESEKIKRSETKTIISIGRLVQVKRHDLLIKAFSESQLSKSGWTLRIFGNGPLETDLRKLIAALSLERNVVLEGVVDDLAEALASASFFVSCSEMEGFGLAVAEALSAGVPVVADAATSGLNKLIVDGSSGLLVRSPDKVRGFSNAMSRLALEPQLRWQLANGALQRPRSMSSEEIFSRWKTLIGV